MSSSATQAHQPASRGATHDQSAAAGHWPVWIVFASVMMILIGTLDFFQGLIAIGRGRYFLLTADQILIFNFTTWGWITLAWGLVITSAGVGLLMASNWARWATVVLVGLNVVVELAFVGSAQFPLWALTVLALSVLVIYALVVHWDDPSVTGRRVVDHLDQEV